MLFGYILTATLAILAISLIASLVLSKKDIGTVLKEKVDRYSLFFASLMILFFLFFSIMFVSPVEQLYFDENIYQGIAMNILLHGNALWCQYGTAYFTNCYANSIYHDMVGWTFFLAVAFGIFGIGIQTAFNLQLLAGALSILFVFLLSSVLLERKDAAIAATVAFALMPELFIWARTQAVPDLPFMMFSTLAFFLFIVYTRRPNNKTLVAFLSSMLIAIYTRTEGILLIGVFAVLYLTFGKEGVRKTLSSRINQVVEGFDRSTETLVILLLSVLLLLPNIFFVASQLSNADYGQSYTNQQLFSLSNFQSNMPVNLQYLIGTYNAKGYFPTAFPGAVTVLAIIGLVYLAAQRKKGNRIGMLLFILLWFAAFEVFYGFFYAGSALFGVDVRFMLQITPQIAILAGMGAVAVKDMLSSDRISGRLGFGNDSLQRLYGVAGYAVAIAVFILLPFIALIPNITLKLQNMPQQGVIGGAVTYFYNNYQSVPQNCMVFTFTPDLWTEFGRGAAQIGYLQGRNLNFTNATKSYSCFVLDYGYWCQVPPFRNTTCKQAISTYRLKPLAQQNGTSPYSGVGFYQIMNYTP